MGKRVVVIASGETERRSLPYMLDFLREEEITIIGVRYPQKHRPITVATAAQTITVAWFELQYTEPPDKFVVLVDVDGKHPDEVLSPIRHNLAARLDSQITASIQFACAQWHLEAWFFGDSENLRYYLGRNLGSVDVSQPDIIENPKQHLRNLLDDNYTATTAEAIARQLDPQTIVARSPSFRCFIEAVRNGEG